MAELRITNLRKTFGDTVALDDVSLTARDGELLTLLGPSGCGKSTTLWSIAGLHHPDSGSIEVGDDVLFDSSRGTDLAPEERNCGVVFQSYAIWPHMSVAGNVGYPLKLRRVKGRAREERVNEVLEMVELGAYAKRYPHELSGGQQQRVALARALAHPPSLLLLDEPFSNLDAKLRERAREWLKLLQHNIGVTTVFVTHDQDEALSMSDRIVVMNYGEIRQIGTPQEIYNQPADLFVADFIGTINLLEGEVLDSTAGTVDVRLDGVAEPLHLTEQRTDVTGRVKIAVRPEVVVLRRPGHVGPGANLFTAPVVDRSYLGDHYRYWVRIGDATMVIQADRWVDDAELVVEIPSSGAQLFPADQRPAVDETEVASLV